ncbi:hypothetical protein Bbelb_155810 [Branchiostoma belcheri]|nr:hypothetical protein Bbelb_155810 [Branchiostoma belcheri]
MLYAVKNQPVGFYSGTLIQREELEDSRQDRLNPFNIHIGDSDQVSTNPKCGGDHRIELNQPFISVSCLGMMGRYVGVRLPGASRVLSLCEVQIYLADWCPPLCPPTNGTMRGSNYFGEVITFTCDSGYRLVGASSLTCQTDATWTGAAPTCTDVDECVAGNGGCEQFCTNTIGSFNCSCATGFTLNVDQITCSGMPPPANISVKHVSEKSATVQWEQPVRDVLIGYRAWLTDKETMLTILTQYLPELVTTATFSPLTPATEYVVAVTCISPYVEGPQAEVLVVTYTDPPRQLYVEDITYKSLLLSWIPPVAKLTGYELTYSKKEHYRKRRSVRSVTLPGDITNYAVQGLVPVTQYVISLTAMKHLEDEMSGYGDEKTSLESLIRVITEIDKILQPDTALPSSTGLPPELDLGIELLRKSSDLLRSTEGASVSAMESVNEAVVHTVTSLVQMLPAERPTLLDESSPLFELDIINVNSVDVSPKQQLKNIKNQQRTNEQKMIVTKKNLFSWNASTFQENITTPMTMFSIGHPRFDDCSVQLELSIPVSFGPIEQPRRRKRGIRERGYVGTQLALDNATMTYHVFDVPAPTVVVLIHMSWWDHAASFQVFFRYDSPPTEELYDDRKVHVDTSASTIKCSCNIPKQKAVIVGSSQFLPNSIDFDNIFKDPDILKDNNIVFYTGKVTETAGTGNKKPLPLLSVLPPDRMPAPYLYQITVNTGLMFGAGTSARIGFKVFGSKSKTAVKIINPSGEVLLRGGTCEFIMPLKASLGDLERLHIWHDNSGGGDDASWFLKDLIIKDLQTENM